MNKLHNTRKRYAFIASILVTTISAALPPSTDYPLSYEAHESSKFGGWSISEQLFKYIRKILPEGCTILELGSGQGTQELAQHYNVISVEHDKKSLNLYPSSYIYAPIVNGWYDVRILEQRLKDLSYDLILVDGPTGAIDRSKFLDNLHLFNLAVPIIFNNSSLNAAYESCIKTAEHLGRSFEMINAESTKSFGIIFIQASQ